MKLLNFLVMLFLFSGAVFFAACEGDMGPAGPKGDKGDPGVGDKGDKGDKGDPGFSYDSRCDVSNGINALLGVSQITGSDDDDVICGNKHTNIIDGGAGDDTIYGEGGADGIYGGPGNDTLNGGDGPDVFFSLNRALTALMAAFQQEFLLLLRSDLTFTAYTDTMIIGDLDRDPTLLTALKRGGVSYRLVTEGITIDLSTGSFDASAIGGGTFTFEGIENIIGGSGDDAISGNAVGNYIFGGNGNDTINGKSGNDLINGGRGNNNLTGGAGADTFIIRHLYKSSGKDTITDFNASQNDLIRFHGFPRIHVNSVW